jgi:plastocyanin
MRKIIPPLLALLLSAVAPAWAADHQVTLSGLSFSPSALTINQGDTVTFTYAGGSMPHNAVADDGSFNSGSASSSAWTYTTPAFNTTGAFRYYCVIHGAPGGVGMSGTITVQSYNPPPPPDFSVAAQSGSATVTQGASATDTITITPTNGFSGNVAFTASGLPSGVTASFGSGTATSSVLTLNASASAATGTSNITVTGTSGSLTHSVPISLTVNAAASNFSIVPGITGSWYLPAQSGHGFNVEVLANNGFLAFWYVYDNSGNNLWLVGQGTYTGDTATMDLYQGTGGMFPPNFDKTKIVRTKWGTMTMTFTDCNNATAQWTPIVPGYASGSMALQRLTGVTGVACP